MKPDRGKPDVRNFREGGWKRGQWWNCEPTPQPKGRGWKPSTYRCARQCPTRQAAVFVIAVEEGVLLAPVGLHVGGVDIEGDARGRRLVGVEKQGDEQLGEFLEVGDHLVIAAVAGFPGLFQPAQR